MSCDVMGCNKECCRYECDAGYQSFPSLLTLLSPPFIQIKRSFPTATLPDFPPKKILTLDAGQLDERRFGIEKYLQGSE